MIVDFDYRRYVIVKNGGIWICKYTCEIVYCPSISEKTDINAPNLSMDEFVNWSFYINGTDGMIPDGKPLNLADMLTGGLEDKRPWYNTLLDWGAMNGANTKERKISLPNGSYVTFSIIDPAFEGSSRKQHNDIIRGDYNEDLLEQSIVWYNWKYQNSTVMRAKFSDRETFKSYVKILGL